jgi:hypothetical protein
MQVQQPLFPPSLVRNVSSRAIVRASTPCTKNADASTRLIRQPYMVQKAVSRHRQHFVKTQAQALDHIIAFWPNQDLSI